METSIKTETINIPSNSLVVYEGGGYDGCFWEFNSFVKDKEGKYHNIHTTGYAGLKDEQLTDEYLSEHFATKNISYEFINLADEKEILEYTKRANTSNVLHYGTKVNLLYNKLYQISPMVVECEMCHSIETIFNNDTVIGVGLVSNGGISYSNKDIICMECYSQHTCGYCGEFHEDIKDMYLGKDGEHCIHCLPKDEVEDEEEIIPNRTIKIAFAGLNWFDLTNDINIGSADELVTYVNNNRYLVDNHYTFMRSNEFWFVIEHNIMQNIINDLNT
jgi:hypothetical protein